MFDLAKKDIDYSNRSVKFWDEVEKKNVIPDRTSQSLRTAWRKFSALGEEEFIKLALKDNKIRFSHQFEAVPYLNSHPKPKPRAEETSSNDESIRQSENVKVNQLNMEEASNEDEQSESQPEEDEVD